MKMNENNFVGLFGTIIMFEELLKQENVEYIYKLKYDYENLLFLNYRGYNQLGKAPSVQGEIENKPIFIVSPSVYYNNLGSYKL